MHPSTRLDQDPRHPRPSSSPWANLLDQFLGAFTKPSFSTFCKLVVAWILCPGRHTITRLYLLAEIEGDHAHDAYHRFFRDAAWNFQWLWHAVTVLLVQELCARGTVRLAVDDTIFRKWGREVEGSGRYKDPLRSLGRSVTYMSGLNVVCLSLLVATSWGTLTVALPIGMRLYRKQGPSHVQLALEMLQAVAEWLPDREFMVVADGAYSRLARSELERITVISRSRKNAEIYDSEFPRLRGPGRPRRRGDRLPSPAQMAADPNLPWRVYQVPVRARVIERQIFARRMLWWATSGPRPLLLVIVRDPSHLNRDEYLFCTDVAADPQAVAAAYADRWVVEVMHRDCKQLLAAETPQCWRRQGPERAGAMSLLVYSLVWYCYLNEGVERGPQAWPGRPWYPAKAAPAFADALAAARRQLWRGGHLAGSRGDRLRHKFEDALVEALAYAA